MLAIVDTRSCSSRVLCGAERHGHALEDWQRASLSLCQNKGTLGLSGEAEPNMNPSFCEKKSHMSLVLY
jgi:hypothetical protein